MRQGDFRTHHASQDTVTGFLLAGIGCTLDEQKNFMVVDDSELPLTPGAQQVTRAVLAPAETKRYDIEATFNEFVTRHDIGLLMINQNIADDIRHTMLASGASECAAVSRVNELLHTALSPQSAQGATLAAGLAMAPRRT